VESVEYLAEELERYTEDLPDGVLFLRGMAARAGGDEKQQIRHFGAVRQNGGQGYVYGISAHLYGLLTDNRSEAESAFRDSLDWYTDPSHRAQVWHSLGNLLSKNSDRWDEAEEAFKKSLELLDDPSHRVQVWHSLGNLLSEIPDRWDKAEEAYEKSLELDDDPASRAQVYLSWANALSKRQMTEERSDRIEEFALKARSLSSHPKTRGISYRLLADVYEYRGQLQKAVESLWGLYIMNSKLGIEKFQEEIRDRISRIRKKK
jgi:tetratricopeptide (TPR) repeat protein